METAIGIREENRTEIGYMLSKLLADEFVLYTKSRNAHWNVEGIDFATKHKFFEDQYEQLDEIMDEVAERIRELAEGIGVLLPQQGDPLDAALEGIVREAWTLVEKKSP